MQTLIDLTEVCCWHRGPEPRRWRAGGVQHCASETSEPVETRRTQRTNCERVPCSAWTVQVADGI